jgi:hypothetical protein
VIVLLLSPLAGYASEAQKQDAEIRLDDDGCLYYMDYTKDYYSPEVMDAMRKIGYIDRGCLAFLTHNLEGECISCKKYDYPHRGSAQDRTLTGLSVVLHCKPEGKYESIAVGGAVFCDTNNPLLKRGVRTWKGLTSAFWIYCPTNAGTE